MTSPSPLFILYGSATGNSEHIAKDLAATYESWLKNPDADTFFPSVVCAELDQFKKKGQPVWEVDPSSTSQLKHGVLVVTATTGNGDAPENASRFVRFIKRKNSVDAQPFRHVAFSVLGLGDTNYDQFCNCAKQVDKKMSELGGTRVKALACADEAVGLEDVVEKWTSNVLMEITNACRGGSDKNGTIKPQNGGSANVQPLPEHKHKDENAQLVANGVPSIPAAADNAAVNSAHSSIGVRIVRSLLARCDKFIVENQSAADPSTLPTVAAAHRVSCQVFPAKDGPPEVTVGNDSYGEQNELIIGEDEDMEYDVKHPFESSVVAARYLTATPTESADKIGPILRNAEGTSQERMMQAQDLLDQSFPLVAGENGAVSDADVERNGKRVLELTLSLPSPDDKMAINYLPGDSLGLLVENPVESVHFVLQWLQERHNVGKDQWIVVESKDAVTIDDLVKRELDLSSTLKRAQRRVICELAQYATDPVEKWALLWIASKTKHGEEVFDKYIDQQRITVVDLLRAFPSLQKGLTLEGLVRAVPPLPPRYYSVCSSPLVSNADDRLPKTPTVTIAFAVVDYVTPSLRVEAMGTAAGVGNGSSPQQLEELGLRRIRGVATRYLEAISCTLLGTTPLPGDVTNSTKLRIFPKPTADFRLPESLSTPLVLIGPGTGVAPFMGFLAHRAQLKKASSSSPDAVGSVDLYFGCRHQNHDWLYRNEMQSFLNEGSLTKLYTAFSRDGNERKYVQDYIVSKNALATNGEDLSSSERLSALILEKNAIVYVCGDGNAMAKDVQTAIVELLAQRLGGGADEAASYLDKMKANNRFRMDIWS